MSKSGWALKHATKNLKGDREIVMKAVSQEGLALQFAAEELKADREIVMTAVAQLGVALQFATKDLKEDKELLQRALEGPRNRRSVVGMKVALLSGRCCTEVFPSIGLRARGVQIALKRCAASLNLDPDYAGSSAAS